MARSPLLNSWEGFGFNFNSSSLARLARATADLGISRFVLDDGWFDTQYSRDNDTMGLGDWTANPAKSPEGLRTFAHNITRNRVSGRRKNLSFGIWMEPEMVNPESMLYKRRPDWVLSAPGYPSTLVRNQLVLNLGRADVQDYIIDQVSHVIKSARITYIKWDNNRGIHELAHPSDSHAYLLGLCRVLDTLTIRHPDVLWEGCASGGGRFDAGLLHYWPQHWTSDNTDAIDRLSIQMGTSFAFPPSPMACHVSAVPNAATAGRITSITFRAHVALMCGSFGFEFDPEHLSAEEYKMVPDLVALSERISPLVIMGSFYRLANPDESNWPAVQFLAQDADTAAVIAYQIRHTIKPAAPVLQTQGLDSERLYRVDGNRLRGVFRGSTLMTVGLDLDFRGDADSQVLWLYRV